MSTQSVCGIAFSLALIGLVGCSSEPAAEEAGSASQDMTADAAAPDNTATPENSLVDDPGARYVPDDEKTCETIPLELPGPNYDASLVPIESAAVQAWLGTHAIPVRAQSYAPDVSTLPQLGFETFDNQQVIDRLVGTCGAVLGVSGTPTVKETTDTFSLKGVNGVGYCHKDTGLCSCSRDEPMEGTVVTDSAQAINVALEWIVELGLVALPEHVTLDVLGVSATMPQKAYGVSFGYRYDGVPLLRESVASVRLGANGGLEHYHEDAPRIAEEVGEPVELVDEVGLEARRNDAYACYPVLMMQCGYTVESETEAGVGCWIDYDNLDSGDPMTAIVGEEISLELQP